jgi:glycogen synthase
LPQPAELFAASWIGILNYREGTAWKQLQRNAMAGDFSWERSADEYDAVYKRARFS